MKVQITVNERGNPPGKLADAALLFDAGDGVLAGLTLIGFAVWERRGSGGRNVTFPARQYSVNGERRSFALLRPADTALASQEAVKGAILDAYQETVDRAADDAKEQAAADVEHRRNAAAARLGF